MAQLSITAEALARMPKPDADATIRRWTGQTFDLHNDAWPFWELCSQRAPDGPWRVWLVMAGRGFGKTRMGAEWVRARAEEDGKARIALVGATAAEARSVMVEGESGLLSLSAGRHTMQWEPSLRRIRWSNGAEARLYSAAEPEGLRGPQHHFAWADEIAKWPHGVAAWDNLSLGMRLGEDPRIVATTTPRPVPLLKRLVDEPGVERRGGRTRDNIHLPAAFIAAVAGHAGTRLGRQELEGELIEDHEHALWTRETIEACRAREVPELVRVVIGVDPPASEGGDACGIVAVGLSADGQGWVLADESVSGASPARWAEAVASAAARWGADRVIAEKNNGGDMVEAVLRGADAALPVRLVHAARGKATRAEPVAALYEKGRIRHAGGFPALEDELCGLIAGGGYEGPGRSPDRADALVWALWDLMLRQGVRRVPRVRLL